MATRGSAKLLEERTIPKKDLQRLWKLLEEDERTEIVGWRPIGVPVTRIEAILKVDRKDLGGVVGTLAEFDDDVPMWLHSLPIGIPRPDQALVQAHVGGTAQSLTH
jgi:hypothetical protein